MRYSAVVLTLICALSMAAQAGNKYMYSFGGAGDAPDEVNMFTSEFNLLAVTAKGYGWKNHILFNGQHSKDIDEVKSQAGDDVKKFSQKNFTLSLQQILSDVTASKIKSGDQVMIVIDTHGSPVSSGKSHQVACSDGECDLKELEQVIHALENKGVKTAIVDLSCYSGHSLNLASDKTCVITSTSKYDVSWDTFAVGFTSVWVEGNSLEQAFLQTRSQIGKGLPQISSPAGLRTKAAIETLGREAVSNPAFADILKSPLHKPVCASNNQMKKTLHDLDLIGGDLELRNYQDALTAYQKVYQQAQNLAQQIHFLGMNQVKTSHNVSITWTELAGYGEEWTKKEFPAAYELKQQLKKNPQFQKFLKLQVDFNRTTQSQRDGHGGVIQSPLMQAALKVQEAERDLYDRIYRQNQKTEKGKNPCADFLI